MKRKPAILRITLTTVASVALLAPAAARAALTNCALISTSPSDYKIVLDDLSFGSEAAKNDAFLSGLQARLRFALMSQLNEIRASAKVLQSSLQVPLTLVACDGRKPSAFGNEFTKALAENLSNERVVVEMWGTLDLRTSASGVSTPHALIGYTIPPVQHYVREDVPAHLYVLEYPKKGAARSPEELENVAELYPFALVGLGTKAAKARLYDLAVWAFTRAEGGIQDARLTGSNSGLDALMAYVKRSSCMTRASALTDPNYAGPLKLIPSQPCAVEP